LSLFTTSSRCFEYVEPFVLFPECFFFANNSALFNNSNYLIVKHTSIKFEYSEILVYVNDSSFN